MRGPCIVVVGYLASAGVASASPEEVAFAEALVHTRHVEGVPYVDARALTPAGVGRLIEMLADPAESRHRVRIVMALGMSGSERAYPALAAFHAERPVGEVDSAHYLARRSLPLAMGYLARSDPRALGFLLEAALGDDADAPPAFSFRHLRGERLAGVLRRAAISGLAISGRPEAAAALQELEAGLDARASDELRLHVREAQSLCGRVMREGPERVFETLGRSR